MPQSILRRDRVLELLPHPLSDAALEDLLFTSKAELERQDSETLTISVTPDRLDLLSEGGLALHLQGAMDAARGLPPIQEEVLPPPAPTIEADASVDPLRPAIAGLLVASPDDGGLDAGLLDEAVRFQELLHATIGRDRRSASLGIYPYDRLTPPIAYALEPLSGVRFVPLDGSEEITAERFFRDHPMAAKYGSLGRGEGRCLTLRDARGAVLSLPPVLNCRTVGEARVGDRRLLLESTGIRERPVREALGLLSVAFLSRGWTATPVEVRGSGPLVGDGRAIYGPRSVLLRSAELHAIAGLAYPSSEVEARLARARLGAHPEHGGWRVEAPPWRPDVLTPVDVAEDVILAQALRPADGTLPASATRGRRRPTIVFRRRVGVALLGLGFAAPYTSLLVSEAAVARLPGATPVRMTNPVSAEFAYVRDRLLLSHLEVLAINTRRGYPQMFGEVGPVVVPVPAAESGTETRYHASAIVASDTAGFADAASIVEYLLRTVDILAVREPAEIPGMIPGRAARARVAGEVVAEMGEVHPAVLDAIGVRVPVAWAELDLSRLAPLALGREGD
jgi:phenylalanyl-tRNA synthetase beta chain